jgi:hypothetical protein
MTRIGTAGKQDRQTCFLSQLPETKVPLETTYGLWEKRKPPYRNGGQRKCTKVGMSVAGALHSAWRSTALNCMHGPSKSEPHLTEVLIYTKLHCFYRNCVTLVPRMFHECATALTLIEKKVPPTCIISALYTAHLTSPYLIWHASLFKNAGLIRDRLDMTATLRVVTARMYQSASPACQTYRSR